MLSEIVVLLAHIATSMSSTGHLAAYGMTVWY